MARAQAKASPAAKTARGEPEPRRPRPARRRAGASGSCLVVVESPAKGKTLKRLLGPGYEVRASAGHVKDLPRSKLGVDVEHGFAPTYDVVLGKAKVLSDIKRAAREADHVLLATDPDREGEAIAWHVAEELGAAEAGDPRVRRVLFDELTEGAVKRALEAPQPLDRARFEAQQARRILDRLVGFQMSPILWRRVRRGLSAGRVLSVAVRLVVERERALQAFRPASSWSLQAELRAGAPPSFRARLTRLDGREAGLRDGEDARALIEELAGLPLTVAAVERRERRRFPPPPFTTATLLQEAARRLGFPARKTMALAQRLYEGVELEDEAVGLITYLRTDSVRLSDEAVAAVREHIERTYGKDHLPELPNLHPARQAAAQEAHEAVRPTTLTWTPERVAPLLEASGERDAARLYRLVWSRFVACQMAPSAHDETSAELAAGRATFRAEGAVLRFAGHLAACGELAPEGEAGAPPEGGEGAPEAARAEGLLPPLEVGMALRVLRLLPEEQQRPPPPRFDEASLIQELEERGIGRPSTYAAVLSAIVEKGYVEKAGRTFEPTALGTRVTDELVRAFPRQLDVAFTAGVEAKLDAIEAGQARWQEVLGEFYDGFKEDLARAEAGPGSSPASGDAKPPAAPPAIVCEKCGKVMVVRFGRMGEFLACPGYPACRHTMNFTRGADGSIQPVKEEALASDEFCDQCGKPMVVKRGRFGRFLACTGYPACKRARPLSIGVDCPKACGGYVSERRSKTGKTFYGCSGYPACDFVSWDRPRNEACPTCGNAWLLEKVARKGGPVVACPNKECGYERPAEGGAGEASGEPPTPEEVDT